MMRRNPSVPEGLKLPLYLVGGYIAFKAAQGGILGLPIQALTTGVGAAGAAVSKGTTDALDYAFPNRVVAPSGSPNSTAGSNISGPQRNANSNGVQFSPAVDLVGFDASVRGFAWDGVSVMAINGGNPMIIGRASTSADALGVARRWADQNL